MGNIATCPNGHNFDSAIYGTCPYCPKNQTGEKTVLHQGNISDGNKEVGNVAKTIIVQGGNDNAGKTIPLQGERSQDNKTHGFVPQGTRIVTPGEESTTSNRRLVGFLVSYDLNPHGKSFNLFEGKNILGSDAVCDIVISTDPGVSAKHLTILYRGGLFRFKDEFSTNGTFINGEMKEEGTFVDKDLIKVGATRFFFLAIPPVMNP